jgi:alpha-glucosidase
MGRSESSDGKVGDYILLARKSGNNWFVGGLTDWSKRQLDLNLSFLPAGSYVMEIFRDGINADRHAQDYKHVRTEVRSGEIIKIDLAPGGGWVAKITSK